MHIISFLRFIHLEQKLTNNSYMNKLYEPGVIDIVNTNKQKFEPYAELVDTALQNFGNDLIYNQDSFAQQESDEVNELI